MLMVRVEDQLVEYSELTLTTRNTALKNSMNK